MAAIVKRPSGYYVVYYYQNELNQKRQKWESGYTYEQAIARKNELEQKLPSLQQMVLSENPTVAQFIDLWLPIHAQANWEHKTYMVSLTCIKKHIVPYIGKMLLVYVQPFHTELLISDLHKKLNKNKATSSRSEYLSNSTIHTVYVLLKQMFQKAVEWQYIPNNPVLCKSPKPSRYHQEIWPVEAFSFALENIEHSLLHLAVHLAFVCSLRRGEIFAITLDNIDFKERSIQISKTIHRIDKLTLEVIPNRSILRIYPSKKENSKSTLVIKKPKTDSSCRKVFLTKELIQEIQQRIEQKEVDRLNYSWPENNLLFCYHTDGTPIDPTRCLRWFHRWQSEQKNFPYPHIPFHAIRHSSATCKLLLSQGDYKSVQGDTGHKTANVLLNVYAKSQDKHRKEITSKLAEELYS